MKTVGCVLIIKTFVEKKILSFPSCSSLAFIVFSYYKAKLQTGIFLRILGLETECRIRFWELCTAEKNSVSIRKSRQVILEYYYYSKLRFTNWLDEFTQRQPGFSLNYASWKTKKITIYSSTTTLFILVFLNFHVQYLIYVSSTRKSSTLTCSTYCIVSQNVENNSPTQGGFYMTFLVY